MLIAAFPYLFLLVHCWITALLVLSGPGLLEPLAATYFWAPLIAFVTVPSRNSFDRMYIRFGKHESWWSENYPVFFLGAWVVNITLVPLFLWKYLVAIDQVLHKARETIGQHLMLGGQTGLVLTVMLIVTVALLALNRICQKPINGRQVA